MSAGDWHCPEADKNGFVDVPVLREHAEELGRKGFVAAFPVPALYVVAKPMGGSPAEVDPRKSGVQLLTTAIESAAVLRYLGRVAFLAKRPGNLFAHLISIGRSEKNDITIAVDSVSKVHGYFVRGEEGWAFNDHSSTNGSFLDGKALEPGAKTPLRPGSLLRLGVGVTLDVLFPDQLYDRVLG